jgi:hypothetical protein
MNQDVVLALTVPGMFGGFALAHLQHHPAL